MKNCQYCGRENAETALLCWECGTTLSEPQLSAHQTQKMAGKYFWTRPLEAGGEAKAKALAKTLAARRCVCGNVMRPASVSLRSVSHLTAEYYGATYRCIHCGIEREISPGMIGTMRVFGLLALLPFLRPSQFTAISACLYALLPITSWAVFFRLRHNNKTFPEVEDPQTNARFVVGNDGRVTEVRS